MGTTYDLSENIQVGESWQVTLEINLLPFMILRLIKIQIWHGMCKTYLFYSSNQRFLHIDDLA